jgi:hypothetical protein
MRRTIVENLHGSHYWMILFPYWFLAVVMIFFGWGVLFLFRNHFEGLAYDISFASVIGDTGLIGIVMIAAEIIKGQGAVPANWLRSLHFHFFCGVLAIALGIILLAKVNREKGWLGEYADQYHNIVIVPMLAYLLLTLLPVVFIYGSDVEKAATVFFLILWFSLVFFDFKTKRLDQQDWLRVHGFSLRSSRPPWLFQRKQK